MKAVLAEEMKSIEREAIHDFKIPSLSLMETAAFKVSERCFEIIRDRKHTKILVFAGKGNNGGDGLAFCRHIYQKNFVGAKVDIEVIFTGDKNKASDECKTQLNILLKMAENGFDFKIHFIYKEPFFDLEKKILEADIVIDAIIGTGLKQNLRDDILKIVSAINKGNATVISVDCPTGINSDNGEVLKDAVKADYTVTFHLPKIGLLVGEGAVYAGKVILEDINIPYGLERDIKTNVITKDEVRNLIPKRPINGNKGTFGKVFIFAGCDNMPGACVIASKAAYRTGAGLVYSCSVKSVCQVVRNHLPEAVTKVLEERDGFLFGESFREENLKNADAVIIGPGLGTADGVSDFVGDVLRSTKVPIIIDADGLNAVSKDLSILKDVKYKCIVTPHLGEMSRMTGKSVAEIKNNIVEMAREFSKEYGVIVVLKDFRTVIASPDGEVYINLSGSSAMAKGGSGDCLTGVIAALIAQGMDCFHACVAGTYVFGLAGEKFAEKYGEYGLLPGECADFIPIILKELQ